MSIISRIKKSITNIFYPRHIKCICCKDELPAPNVYDLCENCYSNLPFIKSHFCIRCGLQFEKDGSGTCLNCKSNNFDFELARSVLAFDKDAVHIIHKFKYGKCKFMAKPLAYLLYDQLLIQDWKIDLICFVPLYPTRQKDRGYNQSEELAKHLSTLSGIPLFNDIVRLRDTPTQTNLTRQERQNNVKNCFKVNNKKNVKDLNILLIDDVFTTGSTCNEVCHELKKAGASKIYVLTVAHAGFKQKF